MRPAFGAVMIGSILRRLVASAGHTEYSEYDRKTEVVMKKALVVLVILSLIVSSCATSVSIVSYYPPGNRMYPSAGTLLIRVDTSNSRGARGSMSQADGVIIEQIDAGLFFVEDPTVQTVNEYIQAAFALDYARSNAFEIVGEESMADYILDVTVDSHFAMTATNPLKMLLSMLLYLPTIGLSLIFMNVTDLTVENIMTVVLSDRKGNEIYSESFNERFAVSYSLVEAGYYNPSYIRVGLLKKTVTQSLAAITSTL